MLTERLLTDERERAAFAASYERVGGFPLALDSMKTAMVTGFYRGGCPIGGYMLNEHFPFRALQDMPETDAQRILDETGNKKPYEITCVWMKPEDRGAHAGTKMWLRIVCAIFARRDQYLIVSTVNESLRRFYQDVGFTNRYSGDIIHSDGMHSPKYVLTLNRTSPLIVSAIRTAFSRVIKTFLRASRPSTLPGSPALEASS